MANEAAGADAAEAEGREESTSEAGSEGNREEEEPDEPSIWDLPLDALMPEDGIGWGEDIFGPTGPENYDNPYDNKVHTTTLYWHGRCHPSAWPAMSQLIIGAVSRTTQR